VTLSPALLGLHLTADLADCDPGNPWLTDVVALRQGCIDWVRTVGLKAVGECFYAFPSPGDGLAGGITGMVLLAESHLAVHTWPETGHVTLDVFVCNQGTDNTQRAETLLEAMIDGFKPASVQRQSWRRGMPAVTST
jgi:S-adenosylmethionine decarboxylase